MTEKGGHRDDQDAIVTAVFRYQVIAPLTDERALGTVRARVFDAAAGVPRRINGTASSAMIVAAARKRSLVGAQDVHDARIDRGRS